MLGPFTHSMTPITSDQLPIEFDFLDHGYTMRGWDFTREQIAKSLQDHRILNPAIELGTNACPWNCGFCFTEDPSNAEGAKKRLKEEMTFEERIQLIDALAELGAKSINIIGAGEPTIDPHFFKLLEHMYTKGITPIVYTEGSFKLTDSNFVQKLYELNATVVLKVNSLWNETYQNSVVAGPTGRKPPVGMNYFQERAKALDLLIKAGFNSTTPTRLAFDTIVCQENVEEIPQLHRWARKNNIFILFVNYLPSGRSRDPHHGALTRDEQFGLFEQLAKIDQDDFNMKHTARFPYAGGTPCTIRGLGLYVKIRGEMFDCPGQLEEIGNVRKESLSALWLRLRHVQSTYDGGCAPRENFWASQKKHLKDLPSL